LEHTLNTKSPIQPRPELNQLPSVTHGALDFGELAKLGIAPDDVLDFSVNSNPYGPSPAVLDALQTVPLDRYPDRECLALRQALSNHLNTSTERILVGSGIAELLWLIALAYVRPGGKALIFGPTFGEYTNVVRLMGGEVKIEEQRLETEYAHAPNRQSIINNLKSSRLVFICNPNNPSGHLTPVDQIVSWAEANPQTLFVIDEAYVAFAPKAETAVSHQLPNLLILRSMTKDYALAGLRLGYAVGEPEVINNMQKVKPPWSVNALAQAAGIAALSDISYLQTCMNRLQSANAKLITSLTDLGYNPIPSATHYFLMDVGNGAEFRANLLKKGILVRDCASFGLPEFVRIATRSERDNGRLLTTLAENAQAK